MPAIDPRIDAYIGAAPPFAQPILHHIRAVIHQACPQVEETIKWSRPHFQYKGMLCQMSAFKAHCALGFWKGKLLFPDSPQEGMGHFGRITAITDLPSEEALGDIIRQAMKFNDEAEKAPARDRPAARALVVPEAMQTALAANAQAQASFDKGSASFKREYVDWVAGARTEATRARRLQQAVEWLAEGKARNWKYEK
ncbi:YdeI/OmpD-associated family protein [Massilia sp. PAMC28688]|uniref:YdeI/OmpD-associated family protein n=1 Tax=Massilia sp. PAMC28688 TaxID=2861283 RepID=UPI001C62EA4E|nr:YdeI/OmpD-associated family protein [Massilia sp. PAMC28688]QYF92378.1 YdeI/OmpD-associated family protein [Massilia sp. PAMC28688]